ncbi:MAG: AtpZ/AtpI family protein [Bdellovibrionota bacterium]
MLLDPVLLKKTGYFSLVSGELLAFIGGGYWLGSTLDKHWKTAPVLTLVFVFLGLGYCGWRILRLSKEWMKSESDSTTDKG